MFRRRSSEDFDGREPFTIRGHHLKVYAEFMQSGQTPRRFANAQARAVHRSQGSAQRNNDSELTNYYHDLLGYTPQQAQAFTKRLEDVLKRFVQLPPSHPLEIVAAKKDTFCTTAIVGRHCVVRTCTMFDQDYTDRDGSKVAMFKKAARRQGLDGELNEFEYTAHFTDSKPLTLSGIRTAMSVGRLILADPAYTWANDDTRPYRQSGTTSRLPN